MLSKTIVVIAGLLIFPATSQAHPHHNRKPASTVSVTIGWTWVNPAPFRAGHWMHPNYGKSFRTFHEGPPPPRPQANAVWVPGHWERRQRRKVWVAGHWRQ